jgi:hypothetical protein
MDPVSSLARSLTRQPTLKIVFKLPEFLCEVIINHCPCRGIALRNGETVVTSYVSNMNLLRASAIARATGTIRVIYSSSFCHVHTSRRPTGLPIPIAAYYPSFQVSYLGPQLRLGTVAPTGRMYYRKQDTEKPHVRHWQPGAQCS